MYRHVFIINTHIRSHSSDAKQEEDKMGFIQRLSRKNNYKIQLDLSTGNVEVGKAGSEYNPRAVFIIWIEASLESTVCSVSPRLFVVESMLLIALESTVGLSLLLFRIRKQTLL